MTALDKASATFVAMAAQVERLAKRLDALDRKNVTVDVDVDTDKAHRKVADLDRSFSSSIIQVAALGRAMSTIALPSALLTATPALASLGASAVAATGALWLLPAAGFAAGAAIGTLMVGLSGFGEAMKQRGDPEKFAEALNNLSPAARSAAVAIAALGPAWTGMRLDVQERLFAGVTAQINALSATYLPVLRAGLSGVATEINASGMAFAAWARQASTVNDVSMIFGNVRAAMAALVPAAANVAAALTDIGVVGSTFLPGLAASVTSLTERFAAFIFQARQSGQLALWIQGGIDTLAQLGRIAGNVGGILGSMFAAAERSGADFLGTIDRVTAEVDAFLNTPRGENALTVVFSLIRDTVDALLPGLRAVASEILDGIVTLAPQVAPLAAAFSDTLVATAPLVGLLAQLASVVLPPLTAVIGTLGPLLVPVAAGFLAVSAASRGLSVVQGAVVALGQSLGGTAIQAGVYAERLGASDAAQGRFAATGSRISGTLDGIGKALPVLAVALLGVGLVYDQVRSKADQYAQAVISGSLGMQQAVAQETVQIERKNALLLGSDPTMVQYIGRQNEGAQAVANVRAEIERQIAGMPPLEAAQARVTLAQDAHNQAIRQFGIDSPQVRAAADGLAFANGQLKLQQDAARFATDTHTAAMINQVDAAFAASNADLGYERSLIALQQAQTRAAEAARIHSADSTELRQANLDVLDANLRTAESAGRKAEADAVASGAANTAEVRARAQKDELIRLAGQASGPTRTALLEMAAGMDITSGAAANAQLRAQLHKDELGRLAGQASGPMRDALLTLQRELGAEGAAHGGAELQAARHKAELLRLAGTASGPLRTELTNMANQIRTLPDGRFTVTADGRIGVLNSVGPGGTPIRWMGGGHTGGIVGDNLIRGLAIGGVLPGYTPGRDVHEFTSPTGGRIGLSGGEAVMRPEWTRAVGAGYVGAANAAARSGGASGVRRFMHREPPGAHVGVDTAHYADGGIWHRRGYAMGGVVRSGVQPYVREPQHVYNKLNEDVSARLTETVQSRIREIEAAMMGGGGWQWQMQVLRQRFPGLRLISGYRRGAITATGNPSYHGKGQAVDVPPRMDVFDHIRSAYGNPNTKELIFSPAGGRQLHNGRPHTYTGITRAQHFDHVHWAYVGQGGGPGGGGGPAGGNVQRWAGVVQQALSILRLPHSLTQTTLRRMQQESGGNPRAINNWDSNARRGTPSRGLMQVIDPTFRAYRDFRAPNDIWHPLANVMASMRYALARYGSLPAAYNRRGGYDRGGLATGRGLMFKDVIAPERVLNPRETAGFQRLVDWTGSRPAQQLLAYSPMGAHITAAQTRRGGGTDLSGLARAITAELGGDRAIVGQLSITASPNASAAELVGEVTRAARTARLGGRYK